MSVSSDDEEEDEDDDEGDDDDDDDVVGLPGWHRTAFLFAPLRKKVTSGHHQVMTS